MILRILEEKKQYWNPTNSFKNKTKQIIEFFFLIAKGEVGGPMSVSA